MQPQSTGQEGWNKEKEKLKLKFLTLTNKYSIFEGNEQSPLSEKLRTRFAKTRDELHKIIAAM